MKAVGESYQSQCNGCVHAYIKFRVGTCTYYPDNISLFFKNFYRTFRQKSMTAKWNSIQTLNGTIPKGPTKFKKISII